MRNTLKVEIVQCDVKLINKLRKLSVANLNELGYELNLSFPRDFNKADKVCFIKNRLSGADNVDEIIAMVVG